MGIISGSKRKQSKLTYKQLYEIELNNRKLYEKRYKEIYEENLKLQESTGIAELRKENTKLKLELEDTLGFLEQEKQAKEFLLKEREKKNGEQKA